MKHLLMTVCQQTLELVFASLTYLLARWLMDISTPQKDWKTFVRWTARMEGYLRYDAIHAYHMYRAWRLLSSGH